MSISFRQAAAVGAYIFRKKLKKERRYPLVLMLEPLFRCNLACVGCGKIRGVYLQGNEMVRPIFRAWLAPFKDLGALTLTSSNTGGTDHLSFDGVGLPGFQFIQDPVEYDTRTHHSNMDVYERLQADDLKQASVIMAAFIYNAAMRDEKLPRKPLPAAQAAQARP